MKYTEIDGERYEIEKCGYCPFRDMGDDGWNAHCTHPKAENLEIDHDGIAKGCPLRDVNDQYHSMEEIINKMFKVQMGKSILHEIKPCPFCGSTDLKEVYYDDEGDTLEEWMMEEANNDGCDYKSWQEYLDANGYVFMVACPNCHGSVSSKDSMNDAWEKWNRRV